MFKKDSNHALNKRSPNIVYHSVDGSRPEVKPEDCPGFERWKEFSDEGYHAEELHDLRTTRRNISMYDLPDRDSAVEDALDSDEPPSGHRTIENAMHALDCLTETQRQRYLMYTYDGKATRQIARIEGVSQHAIMISLHESDRKIKIFLKNTFSEGRKNDA